MDELVGMKRARLVQEVVQVRLHLVEVLFFPFPHFGGRIRLKRPFLHTFFLVVFQGMIRQLAHDFGWFFSSGQSVEGDY